MGVLDISKKYICEQIPSRSMNKEDRSLRSILLQEKCDSLIQVSVALSVSNKQAAYKK